MDEMVAECRLIFRDNPRMDLSRVFVAGKALAQRDRTQPASFALITDPIGEYMRPDRACLAIQALFA